MEKKKLSSVEQIFSHIKASRNDIQYWNDSMLVDWLLEHEDRLKAMHKEEMDKVAGDYWNEGASYMYDGKRKYNSFEEYYKETFGGQNNE